MVVILSAIPRTISYTSSFRLSSVKCLPKFSFYLLSFGRLTESHICSAHLYHSYCAPGPQDEEDGW